MNGTKYGTIFLVCVIVGSIIGFLPGRGDNELVRSGMQGLLMEQQIAREQLEFERGVLLQEQAEKQRRAEHERQMEILRLQRPALPTEVF
jgi:hypothetical protein